MALRHTVKLLALAASFLAGSVFSMGSEIVANPQNQETLDKETLRLMLTGKEKFWNSGSEVLIAILKSDPGMDETLSRYSGMTSTKFRNHWQRIAFSGRGKMPKMFSNIEDLIAFVEANEGAIGIVSSAQNIPDLRKLDLGLYLPPEGPNQVLFAQR